MIILRNYQEKAVNEINKYWADGIKNILYLSGTGTGKTVVFSYIMMHHEGVCVELAHRKELVDQASITLAKRGVKHSIIAPDKNIKLMCSEHIKETGRCFYDPNSNIYVASLKTLHSKRNLPQYRQILNSCTLWVIDEAHHALKKNQYGKVIKLMPNAKGLGVTATSQRTDGRGLGIETDGLFEKLVEGPSVSWMMNQGYLTSYRIVAPLSKIKFDSELQLQPQFKSQIIGDAVSSYLEYAKGEIGATFFSSVELSKLGAERYNQAGIPAVHLDGTTPTEKRNESLRKLARGEILQLCNVDLVSEGFDLPALSVITICRLTTSLIWHLQVSGRVLRPAENKEYGMIIDHVGNYLNPRLGLPDTPRNWTLERRVKKSTSNNEGELVKRCPECLMVHKRILKQCPFCDYIQKITVRTMPEEVDGDLTMLSPDVLKEISKASMRLDKPKEQIKEEFLKMTNGNHLIANSNAKYHRENQEMRELLKDKILQWRYNDTNKHLDNSKCNRLFWLLTGVDVITAQGLKTKEMKKIIEKLTINS